MGTVVYDVQAVIENLERELAECRARLRETDTDEKLSARERFVAELQRELAECQELRDQLQNALSVKNHLLQECNASLAEAKRELAECRAKLAEAEHLSEAGIKTSFEVEQILGMALYGKSEEGLPLWGEHVPQTLATEAVKKLQEAEAKNKQLHTALMAIDQLHDEAEAREARLRGAVQEIVNRKWVTVHGYAEFCRERAERALAGEVGDE